MKKFLFAFSLVFPFSSFAGIYTNTNNFRPYVGIDFGLNIADYTVETKLDDQYYSATINAGARIARNFGVELFFSHSSANDLEYISTVDALNHEIYYMAYGFDVFAYYPINQDFDFFTSFGVGNYKVYNKYEYISPFEEISATESKNNVTTRFGIGVMYTLPNDNVSMMLQYQYIPINDVLINTMSEFSVGARYIF